MSVEHIREYSKAEAITLLSVTGFEPVEQQEVYVSFPKEHYFRKIVAMDSVLRRALLRMFSNIGTFFVFVAHKIT
ncbi:MAG TPA: hypothetical protein DCP92_05435 [Nitrospiraceae bacterium]|nr:hypothetical protein [Nitrospiraceae bacterium]